MEFETISTQEAREVARLYLRKYYKTKDFTEADKMIESFGLKLGDDPETQWIGGGQSQVKIIDKEKWFLAKIQHGL